MNPLDCSPPDPPERPEIIVEIVDPDGDPVGAIDVRLQYHSGPAYQGEVRMRFDTNRKVFVYTLPPVTRAAVGNDARTISIFVTVPSSTLPPPMTHWIPFRSVCMGTIGNG